MVEAVKRLHRAHLTTPARYFHYVVFFFYSTCLFSVFLFVPLFVPGALDIPGWKTKDYFIFRSVAYTMLQLQILIACLSLSPSPG